MTPLSNIPESMHNFIRQLDEVAKTDPALAVILTIVLLSVSKGKQETLAAILVGFADEHLIDGAFQKFIDKN